MIDLDKAIKAFEEFLDQYDRNDPPTNLKITHTYGVVNSSKRLAKKLNLNEEDTTLSALIALLHDIGRFEQSKVIKGVYDKADLLYFDHAEEGVKILFDKGLIRKFIDTDIYDDIIYKAILNHNKYSLDTTGMNEKEILHSKLIRDNDKIDNYRVKLSEKIETLLGTNDVEEINNSELSDEIYNQFISKKQVLLKDSKTYVDKWFGYCAFIFDLNYSESIELLQENDLINKVFYRIDYKNENTIIKINKMKQVLDEYIKERLSK